MIASDSCNRIVRSSSDVTMATHTGMDHVFAHSCKCLVHDLHTVSYPVPRDEGVSHPTGSLQCVCELCVVWSVCVGVVSVKGT